MGGNQSNQSSADSGSRRSPPDSPTSTPTNAGDDLPSLLDDLEVDHSSVDVDVAEADDDQGKPSSYYTIVRNGYDDLVKGTSSHYLRTFTNHQKLTLFATLSPSLQP
jgi:hypothetical protein